MSYNVLKKPPTYAEQLVIQVVEEMQRKERAPHIRRYIKQYGLDTISVEDLRDIVLYLKTAVDNDEGITLRPADTQTLYAYIAHLELTIMGERHPPKE